MRVAALQWAVRADDAAANLATLGRLAERAAGEGAALVVAPEAAMLDFGRPDSRLVGQPLDGPFVTGLHALAEQLGVTVLAGMFEAGPEGGDRCWNTVVAVGPDGLRGGYRKLHLFDALGWRESERLLPGDGGPLVVEVGDLRVGVMTCYDLRFPELARALVDDGAQLLAVPSAWVAGPHKVDQWSTLLRARAIESTAYVLGAGQAPPRYSGASALVDPYGLVLGELADGEGVVVGEVSAQRVAEVRAAVPSLANRRYAVVPRAAVGPA